MRWICLKCGKIVKQKQRLFETHTEHYLECEKCGYTTQVPLFDHKTGEYIQCINPKVKLSRGK